MKRHATEITKTNVLSYPYNWFDLCSPGILNMTRAEIALQMKSFEIANKKFKLSALTPESNGVPIRNGEFHSEIIKIAQYSIKLKTIVVRS